jgi:ABC-type bacteriocin/lantibiotic exporter with double-glycine peptidase domain
MPSDQTTSVAYTDEAPQAAQSSMASAEEVELVASNDPTMLPAIAQSVDASLTELSAENPKLARKMAKIVQKVEKQAAASTDNTSGIATAKDKNAAQKLIAKAEKKFDIMKAKQANAAQANATLIGLGALLAIVGLVLLLATSGTGATLGLISLIVGVVLLVISLLSR